MNTTDILELSYRDFGKLVDGYIKGDKSDNPLDDKTFDLLQSPEVLPRLKTHMEGLQESLAIQVAKAETELKSGQASAKLDGNNQEYFELTEDANKQIAKKQRFGAGLSEALTQVKWLYLQSEDAELSRKIRKILDADNLSDSEVIVRIADLVYT